MFFFFGNTVILLRNLQQFILLCKDRVRTVTVRLNIVEKKEISRRRHRNLFFLFLPLLILFILSTTEAEGILYDESFSSVLYLVRF